MRGKNICQTTGKGKTGGGERYQQHKQHKPTTIARATTQHALEGFTCGRNRKARLVAGNNVSEVRGERLEAIGDGLLAMGYWLWAMGERREVRGDGYEKQRG